MYYDVSDENNATTEGSTQQKKDHTGFAINAYTSVMGCPQVMSLFRFSQKVTGR